MFFFIFPNIWPQSELYNLLLGHLNMSSLVASWPLVYDRQEQLTLQVAADSDTEGWVFLWLSSVSCGRERCCYCIPWCQKLWAMFSGCTLFRLFPAQSQKKLFKFEGGQPEAFGNAKLHERQRLRRSYDLSVIRCYYFLNISLAEACVWVLLVILCLLFFHSAFGCCFCHKNVLDCFSLVIDCNFYQFMKRFLFSL